MITFFTFLVKKNYFFALLKHAVKVGVKIPFRSALFKTQNEFWTIFLPLCTIHITLKFCANFVGFSIIYWAPWMEWWACQAITASKESVFGVILVPIFPHSDWIRRDISYLSQLSRFVVPDALCNNSLSCFEILDTLCNNILPHFVIPDALCNKLLSRFVITF